MLVEAKTGGPPSNNPLEQFVLLAKAAKGAAAVELVKQVLESPGVFVFGELLEMPNIVELETGPHSKYYNTLHLFAYGTYRDFLSNQNNLLELSVSQKKKLQHLTIVTLATKTKCIPYAVLLQELDMKNVRDLEDLIIEAIYSDIIHGKLDQRNSRLEIDYAIGRDIRISEIDTIVGTLQEWCNACETVLSCVETQINRANTEKNHRLKHKECLEQEVASIKKTLKAQTQDPDEAMATDSREIAAQSDKGKKQGKTRGLRGSGKFWQKS